MKTNTISPKRLFIILSVALACVALVVAAVLILPSLFSDDPELPDETPEPITYSEGLSYELQYDGKAYSVIGTGSFEGEELFIPPEYEGLPVTRVEYRAFADCVALKRVVIPDSVKELMHEAFLGCTALSNVTLSPKLEFLGDQTFAGCVALAEITIPEGVTFIRNGAFRGCTALATVSIPKSMESVYGCFDECTAISDVYYAGSVADWCKIQFFGKSNNPLYVGGARLYCEGKLVSELVIPASVTSFDQNFSGCSSITSVKIHGGVSVLPQSAFENCTSLASVTVENGVTEIDICAFEGCTSLSKISLPDSMKKLGGGTFRGCTSLALISIPSGVTQIDGFTFEGCTALTSVTIPGTVKLIWQYAFKDCAALESIVIPEGVENIDLMGISAFWGCDRLTSITLPVSLKGLSRDLFFAAPNLHDVYFNGTKAQYDTIEKTGFFQNGYRFTVHAKDGDFVIE